MYFYANMNVFYLILNKIVYKLMLNDMHLGLKII